MAIFKCKMCGGTIEFEPGDTVGVCDSCGTKQTLPRLDDETKANLYDRANHFRRNNEYDKAMGIYEQILNEDKTDAEAYWSIVLCRYGIEYVEDPATHKRIPTVNRAQFTSVSADEDFKSAIKYADSLQKKIYKAEAKAIDEIQKGILDISSKEEPFDVFICYKETDANGRRTPDSVLATELYHELTKEGFRVFFSRITLEDKLGTAYEPYIFAALNSSKVMVVLGTKAEHFNAVWVKNEWSRYLSLIKNGAKKMLIPAYRDMDPYDLPEEFSHLQAQDMGKLGFMQDLTRGIKKIISASAPKKEAKEPVSASETANVNIAPLLKRAFMFLEDGNWNDADTYCEKVLDQDPECAQAYLGKLMAELHVNTQSKLSECDRPFDTLNSYQKVLRFGDKALKNELEKDIQIINDRIENARLESLYNDAVYAMKVATSETEFTEAAKKFQGIKGYLDSDCLADTCLNKAEVCRKDSIYNNAEYLMSKNTTLDYKQAISLLHTIEKWKDAEELINTCHDKIRKIEEMSQLEAEASRKNKIYESSCELMYTACGKIENYEEAIKGFQKIPGWKDADKNILRCNEKIDEINASQIEAEKRAAEKHLADAKRSKKVKTILCIVIAVVVLCIAIVFVFIKVIIPNNNYNAAVALMESGKYEEAISAFGAMDGYREIFFIGLISSM